MPCVWGRESWVEVPWNAVEDSTLAVHVHKHGWYLALVICLVTIIFNGRDAATCTRICVHIHVYCIHVYLYCRDAILSYNVHTCIHVYRHNLCVSVLPGFNLVEEGQGNLLLQTLQPPQHLPRVGILHCHKRCIRTKSGGMRPLSKTFPPERKF